MTGTNTISGAAVISGNINSSGTTNTFSGGNILSGTNTFSGTNIFSSDVTLNAQRDLRFADSDSSNWVAFQAPATVASNVTWTLPATDGTSNQVLATNGSGTLSWATAGGGASISAGDSKVEVTDTGSNGTIVFNTDGTERMRVDSSGRVLIGQTSGGYPLDVTGGNGLGIRFTESSNSVQSFMGGFSSAGLFGTLSNHPMMLWTNNAERARIDSSGNLMVGTTGPQNTGSGRGNFTLNGSSAGAIMNWSSGGANKSYAFQDGTNWSFYNNVNGGNVDITAFSAGVRLSSGGTSWSSLSDERQKDIIEPIENAVSKVGTLRAVIGKYKTDEDGTRRSFLIAQDVQSVLPEAVDAQDIERLSLRYTETIPLLVAAIKELSAELDTVKAQNAAFEARLVALEAN
jgi:hypothetical protein